jgi:hypothetical protein
MMDEQSEVRERVGAGCQGSLSKLGDDHDDDDYDDPGMRRTSRTDENFKPSE